MCASTFEAKGELRHLCIKTKWNITIKFGSKRNREISFDVKFMMKANLITEFLFFILYWAYVSRIVCQHIFHSTARSHIFYSFFVLSKWCDIRITQKHFTSRKCHKFISFPLCRHYYLTNLCSKSVGSRLKWPKWNTGFYLSAEPLLIVAKTIFHAQSNFINYSVQSRTNDTFVYFETQVYNWDDNIHDRRVFVHGKSHFVVLFQ